MFAQSFQQIVEGAVQDANDAGEIQFRHASGAITNPSGAFDHANLQALETTHKGVFAFLAFHPKTDEIIATYTRSGSLGSDAGREILALFFADESVRTPKLVTEQRTASWLKIERIPEPAYLFTESFFGGVRTPVFPGIIFFEGFAVEVEPVYVPIPKCDGLAECAAFCRSLFSTVRDAVQAGRTRNTEFAQVLCEKLAVDQVEYMRCSRRSMSEWLIYAYQLGKKHFSKLVGLVKGLIAK